MNPTDYLGAPSEEGPTVEDLILQLNAGTISIKSISREDRLYLVEHLTAEGLSSAKIGKLFGLHERSIRRLREGVQDKNALKADPNFTEKAAGSLKQEAETSILHIRRAMRDPEASPGDRIAGSLACFTIRKGLYDVYQRTGYVRTAPTKIHGELIHQVQEVKGDSISLAREFDRIMRAATQLTSLPEALKQDLAVLKQDVLTLGIAERLESVSETIEKKEPQDE